jgi:acetamidase/formamidase
VLHVAPGEIFEFHPLDASGGQLGPSSTVSDVERLAFAKVNPLAGPVHVDGAEPGDGPSVTLLGFDASG